jgi:hypothetical protein
MNKPSSTFEAEIVESVRRLVDDSRSGTDLFNAMGGVHPIEIKRALLASDELGLLKTVFAGLETRGPTLREVKREDNPVLSFWPFTSDCARKIAALAEGYGSVALLGTPTVFSAIRETQKDNVVLFDSDDYFFREKATEGYVQCDLLSDALTSFENNFDLVIGDPPWYFDEYISWLKAAICLTRPGGTIVFVLYPQNIRDTARHETKQILNTLENLLDEVRGLALAAEYETPSFEQIELIQNGIHPTNWRKAAFVSGKVPLQKADLTIQARPVRTNLWTERRIGCGRIFVEDVASDNSVFLQTAHPKHRFLSSPSRRDPSRKKANVLSSRGHGLTCSHPRRLLELLNDVRVGSDIEKIGNQLDGPSCELFQLIANDLWGRFITV